jgi:hypothetical protein
LTRVAPATLRHPNGGTEVRNGELPAFLIGLGLGMILVALMVLFSSSMSLAGSRPIEAPILDELVVSQYNIRVVVFEDSIRDVLCYQSISHNQWGISCIPTKDTAYGKAIDK